jgi:type IV fimbrial biogenesis protein FimT
MIKLSQGGFTFIELIIAMSILFITTTMVIPAMTSTLSNTRHNGEISLLMSQLQLARTEAIFKNQNMLMCKSSDKSHCQTDITWDQGWVIFNDKNNNKQRDDDEKIVFAQYKINHVAKILYNSFGGSSDYVRFYSRGYSHTNGTFTICHPLSSKSTKTVILSRTGRVRLDEYPKQLYQDKCAEYI